MARSVRLAPAPSRNRPAQLRQRLLRWYGRHRRELPWRQARVNAYAVWVSEIMLQQTRVATAAPYYRRFLQRFPNLRRLAAATEAEVLAAWSGLGYYRRARQLRQAAQAIVLRHGGRFPLDWTAARALPGIGDYTAGAILSIAGGQPYPAVDGNVRRIAARLEGRVLDLSATRAWAEALLPRERPGDLNQALMDLGATVCLPRAPQCDACPVRGLCATRGEGARTPRPQPVPVAMNYAWTQHDGCVWLQQRPASSSQLPAMWELPAMASPAGEPVLTLRHSITQSAITARVYRLDRPGSAGMWMTEAAAQNLPLTGLTRKILRRLLHWQL